MVETPQRLMVMASGRTLEGGGGQGDSFSAGESFSSRYFYRLDGKSCLVPVSPICPLIDHR